MTYRIHLLLIYRILKMLSVIASLVHCTSNLISNWLTRKHRLPQVSFEQKSTIVIFNIYYISIYYFIYYLFLSCSHLGNSLPYELKRCILFMCLCSYVHNSLWSIHDFFFYYNRLECSQIPYPWDISVLSEH